MVTARRSWHNALNDARRLKEELFGEDCGEEDTDTTPVGFRVFRVRVVAHHNRKGVQWARKVISQYRRDIQNGTRSSYPSEEVFRQSRGGSGFRDNAATYAKAAHARKKAAAARKADGVRKLRDARRLARLSKGAPVDGDSGGRAPKTRNRLRAR